MIKFIMLSIISASLCFSAIAQLNVGQSGGKQSPVKIHADNMQYFGTESKSVFTGNVVAINDNYTLTADNVEVTFSDKNDVTKIFCKGKVNFKTEDILAVADRAELNQITKIINLNGSVKVWQKDNYLEGEKVQILYETRKIFVDKGSGDRVTIIFNPSDNMSMP